MTRKKAFWLCAALLAAVVGFGAADTASAGWNVGFGHAGNRYQNSGHSGHSQYSQSRYGQSRYGQGNQRYQSNRRYGQRGFSNPGYGNSGYRWHDTTHYDYHPPSIQRHGNHYDIIPGHYDLHRSGHFDRH